jgi:hypothetical protein
MPSLSHCLNSSKVCQTSGLHASGLPACPNQASGAVPGGLFKKMQNRMVLKLLIQKMFIF